MKKIMVAVVILSVLTISASASFSDKDYLAGLSAKEMRGEPYIVKVAFCEMLVNRVKSPYFPSTLRAVAHELNFGSTENISESDVYAAASALARIGFFKDIFYVKRYSEVKNTPLAMQGGVRLYDWYFYSSGSM